MTPQDILAQIDTQDCLDTLAAMVRHKSYSQTEGEKLLATEMMPTAFEDSGKSIAIGLVTVLGFALAAGLSAIE